MLWRQNRGQMNSDSIIFFVIILFVCAVFIAFKIRENKKDDLEIQRWQEAQTEAKQKAYKTKQQAVHQRILGFVTESSSISEDLPSEIEFAKSALSEAEAEFKEGAFAPFWDEVERAATSLARFENGVKQINDNSICYKNEKDSLDSAPPPFKVKIAKLSDVISTVDRMQKIVRIAQKDFHFSTIYEQRKTNKLLVKGFSSLGQALTEMSSRIESSMYSLSESISELREDSQENARKLMENVESLDKRMESDSIEKREHERKERKILDQIKNQK